MEPRKEDWTAPDDAAAENEMQELLYALVRMLKPRIVVETGAYLGHSTARLGLACAANGKGRVISCEPNADYWKEAAARCVGLPVEVRRCKSEEVPELERADFVFSDSDYKYRIAEISRCKKGAIVVVHDTRISYDPNVLPLEGLVSDLGGLTFNTYRGFGILIRSGTH